MVEEDMTITPSVLRLSRTPFFEAARDFTVFDLERQAPISRVELDAISRSNRCQRAADGGFRRHVEDRRSVSRPAHPRIADSNKVHHIPLEQFLRNRQMS